MYSDHRKIALGEKIFGNSQNLQTCSCSLYVKLATVQI